MPVESVLGSALAATALAGPAAILVLLAWMRDAPGEWGRAALSAWICLAAMLVAGAAAGVLGPVVLVAVSACAFAAVVLGGPWGSRAAALTALLVAGSQVAAESWPVHHLAAPALAAASVAGALAWSLRRG